MNENVVPLVILLAFEAVAVGLWLAMGNLIYLLNFSYVGCALTLGIALYIRKSEHARRVTQLLVGLYMIV